MMVHPCPPHCTASSLATDRRVAGTEQHRVLGSTEGAPVVRGVGAPLLVAGLPEAGLAEEHDAALAHLRLQPVWSPRGHLVGQQQCHHRDVQMLC